MTDQTRRNSVAEANWRAYERGRSAGQDEYVRLAKQCDDYYNGDQWDPTIKAELEAVRRPALTLNSVKRTVNALLGEQIKQRAEITLRPKRHTTAELADIQTRLMHHILEANRYRYQESRVFADGLIQDRGFFDVRLDFTNQIQGEVQIVALDPLNVIIDAGASEYDPETWSEVIVTQWMTPDEVAVHYGRAKAEELNNLAGLDQTFGTNSMLTGEDNTFGDVDNCFLYGTDEEGSLNWQYQRVRVIDRQYRRLERAKFFLDLRTGDMHPVPEWSRERANSFAAHFGYQIIEQLTRKIRWTVTADDVVLHDNWSPYQFFTVVPYFPYFRRGNPTGVVRDLIDPQDQYNKISSQELHVVNTTANSGWVVEAGSLVNMTEAELEERGAQTGLVVSVRPGTSLPPTKIQPNQIPSGLDRLAQKAKNDLREISGVDALLGEDSAYVSGVALDRKQSRALVNAEVLFDNLNLTRTLVATRILSLVQRFYTEPRVYFITLWDLPGKPGAEMAVNQPHPSGKVINDLTLGEYDVSIAVAPSRETFDDVQFAEALQLREAGVLIPDDVVVEYSHLTRRDDIAERIRKMMGAGDPTPEEVQVRQMQMQMQMDQAQAALDELRAKAQHISAQAELAHAKAEATLQQAEGAATTEGARMQLAHQQLQADILAKLAELQNKIDVAKLHTTVKVATTAMQNTHAEQLEQLKARLAPNRTPATTKGKT